jgi:hypothetical protein
MTNIFTQLKSRGQIISRILVAFRQVITNLSVSIPRSSEQIHGKLRMLLAGVIYSFMSLILASMLLVASVSVWVYFLSCKAYQTAERQLKTFT